MPQTIQDKRSVWSPFGDGYTWDSNRQVFGIPSYLTVLKHTTFDNGVLGHTALTYPEIYQYAEASNKYGLVVVAKDGQHVLRHNLNDVDTGVDPISGQVREGNLTHYFKCLNYYSAATHPNITYKVTHRLDHSYWRSNVAEGPFPYPMADGKYFLEDKTKKHEAIYLGLKNYHAGSNLREIRLVAGNAGSGYWSPSSASWTNVEPFGWKNNAGVGVYGLDLKCDDGFIFSTDGQFLTFTLEIRYNPNNIGYHKARILSDTGSIYRDLTYTPSNTDANGWFNLPITYEFQGGRIYSNNIAFTTGRQDFTTNPELFSGYCGGYEVKDYWIFSGVRPDVNT